MHSATLGPEHSAYRSVMQLAYSGGMTNGSPRQVRRRENLRKLIDANGGQAQVALEIGTPKSHLSAILAGRRGIGDALAQKIEENFGLPAGALDSAAEAIGEPEVAGMVAELGTLHPIQKRWVLLTLREALKVAREISVDGGSDANDDASSIGRKAA